MGIYGAMSTAVAGLRAQSLALENISGNIANVQTSGYKRMETSFSELVPGASMSNKGPSSVIASGRQTVNVQGSVSSSDIGTHMAITGDGFFAVRAKEGMSGGNAVLSEQALYTRRGDFEFDKEGYLVNGSGYYLTGVELDKVTGQPVSSQVSPVKVERDFIAAQQTTEVQLRANLPTVPDIENVDPATAAETTFTLDTTGAQTLTIGTYSQSLLAGATDADVIAAFEGDAAFDAAYSITSDNAGNFTVTSKSPGAETAPAVTAPGATAVVPVDGTAAVTRTVMDTGLFTTSGGGRVITADDDAEFQRQSLAGGSITVRTSNGEPMNLQLRWAKTDSFGEGGTDTWSLMYMSSSTGTGTDPVWKEIGEYAFDRNGVMTGSTTPSTTPITIDGVSVGDVALFHGSGGLSQYADPNGLVRTTALEQNGYAAGELVDVGISESGRVTAIYSNGQSYDLYDIPLTTFNAPNKLQGMDGSAYAETFESGAAVKANGSVSGNALEGSNTDIADEFTKLIVTQQAYSAGTRIVTTSDEMMQEALNMKR